MKCFNGIQTSDLCVPCGQCMPCRINKGRQWSARILLEQIITPDYCHFVTLTYNDEHVPTTAEYVQTLRKKPFLKWLNNVVRVSGPFRYYAIGEYGDLSMRPHMHLAIFPQRGFRLEAFLAAWTKGFTSAYPLEGKRARYLAQYTTKKLTKNEDQRLERDQEPEFRTSSRHPGLGAGIVGALVSQYRSHSGKQIVEKRGDVERTIRIDGKIYPLTNFILAKVRERLGIPLLHRDRLSHEGYEEWHQIQEAEKDEQKYINYEVTKNAETQRKIHRTPHRRL